MRYGLYAVEPNDTHPAKYATAPAISAEPASLPLPHLADLCFSDSIQIGMPDIQF